jgi:hypothetical protein
MVTVVAAKLAWAFTIQRTNEPTGAPLAERTGTTRHHRVAWPSIANGERCINGSHFGLAAEAQTFTWQC